MKTTMADIYRIMGKINSEGGKVRVEQAGSGGLNLYVDRISPYDDKIIDKGHEYFLRGTKKDIYEALIKIRFIPQYRPYSVRANRRKKTRCWKGYKPVKGKRPYSKGSCRKVVRRRKIPLRTARAMVRAGLPVSRSELRGNQRRRTRPHYYVGGLSSLGAKGEERLQQRIFNQIKKSVEAENVSYGELATLASIAKSHPKLFMGEPRMAEVAGMTEARYRRLQTNSIEIPERSSWVGLQILTPAQVLKEFYPLRKSISDESEPMLFFRTGTSESTKTIASLARKVGRYNNFNGRKIAPFIEKLGRMYPHISVILGREYSPVLYLDNIEEELGMRIVRGAKKHFNADEASYDPLRRRVRLWWD